MASTPPILLMAVVLVTACSDPASAPTSPPAANLAVADDRVANAALFVGNLSFLPTDAVLRYTGAGTFIDRMVPVGSGGLTATCCIAFGPDENLYVSSPPAGGVLRYNGVTGAFIDVFIPSGRGGLILPTVLEFNDGGLYVADGGANAVRRYDAVTGTSLGDFIPPRDHGLSGGDPGDFEFGPDGAFYISSQGMGGRILRYDGSTGAFIDEVVAAGVAPPTSSGLTFGRDGHLFATSLLTNEVRRYDVVAKRLIDVFVAAGSGGLSRPIGITFGPDDNLYVSSLRSREVLRYDGVTGAFIDAFVPSGYGGLSGPRALLFKEKIAICHSRGGNAHTLHIGYMSGFDHVAHGDAVGPCR